MLSNTGKYAKMSRDFTTECTLQMIMQHVTLKSKRDQSSPTHNQQPLSFEEILSSPGKSVREVYPRVNPSESTTQVKLLPRRTKVRDRGQDRSYLPSPYHEYLYPERNPQAKPQAWRERRI